MNVLGYIVFGILMAYGLYRGVTQPRPKKEVVGRRSTVTRVIAGGLIGGPVGAIAGYAWKKKEKADVIPRG